MLPAQRAVLFALMSSVLAVGPDTALAVQTTPAPPARGEQEQATTLVLPGKDASLQAGLETALKEAPFRSLVARKRLSVALADLSQPGLIRYAGVDDDRMRYAASLPKIAIMLGVFDQIDKGDIAYTPELRRKMERMIRESSNREASELIKLVGFDNIARTLEDPHYELYHENRKGGLWVGKDYGGDLGRWKRDPLHHISHGATARQVVRFFVMIERGELVSPWASSEMKQILAKPEIKHKFVLGLSARPASRIFRKSGTWREWHSDAALVERDGKKYVAVALMESNTKGVLARLIVKLDDLVHRGKASSPVSTAVKPPSAGERPAPE